MPPATKRARDCRQYTMATTTTDDTPTSTSPSPDIDNVPSKRSISTSSWFGSKRIKENEIVQQDTEKKSLSPPITTSTAPKPIANATTRPPVAKTLDKSTPPLSSSAGSVNSWFRLRGKASKPDLATVVPNTEENTRAESVKADSIKAESVKAESVKTDSIKADSANDLPRPEEQAPTKILGLWNNSNSSKTSVAPAKTAEPTLAQVDGADSAATKVTESTQSNNAEEAAASAAAAAAAMPPPPLPSSGWFGLGKKPSKETFKNIKADLPQRSVSLPSSPLVKAVDVPNESIAPIAPISNVNIKDTSSDQTPHVTTAPVISWWSYVGMGQAQPVSGVDADPVKVIDDKAASVKSAESAARWQWFGTWTGGGTQMPTPAEQVKAAAMEATLNGDASAATAPSDAPPASTAPAYNPISSSARSNRSPWAYFFTSNSNLQPDTKKKVTDVEESNMEVMTVPSAEELAGVPKAKPVKTKKPPPTAIEAAKSTVELAVPKQVTATKAASLKSPAKNDNVIVDNEGATSRPSTPTTAPPRKETPSTRPNVVLPAFEDVFGHPKVHRASNGFMSKTLHVINNYIFNPITVQQHEAPTMIPKVLDNITRTSVDVKKAVIIGIHGWFPGTIVRSIFGAPTGTSSKFKDMMADALKTYLKEKHDVELPDEAVTAIALDGEGKVEDRVAMHYTSLLNRTDWMKALQEADVILFATHSQGSIVSTFLIARLIEQGHVRPERGQRICAMMMCGIHHGPFTYLNGNVVVKYLEAEQARELFEFQDSDSRVHKKYVQSWRIIIRRGVKLVYVSSMADNVVPIYSAIFDAATHPSILRAIFIDGTTFNADDFLTNLIVFCLRLRNAGLSDHGLLLHLSDILVGSMYGDGHSLIYFDKQVYTLAVRYLFETTPLSAYDEPMDDNADGQPGTSGQDGYVSRPLPIDPLSPTGGTYNSVTVSSSPPLPSPHLSSFSRDPTTPPHRPFPNSPRQAASVSAPSSFRARTRTNPYYLPWAMRGVFDDPDIRRKFGPDLERLMNLFELWDPQTKALKDVRYRLEPLRRGYANAHTAAQKKAML